MYLPSNSILQIISPSEDIRLMPLNALYSIVKYYTISVIDM
jgi:hypothetical protein